MKYATFFGLRFVLAIALLVYGANTVFRFAQFVKLPAGTPKELSNAWELVFWTVVPPLWFFVEYYMLDHGWINISKQTTAIGKTKDDFLKEVKVYAEYASKVWAAILAVALVLYGTLK